MYNLATIKYPTDPSNRSYKPSRARWISHYARQIHLAIANGATPAISYTMRNLMSDLSRTALPPDLDPCIPAFQLNNTVLSERHPDNSAYESLDATGRIIVQDNHFSSSNIATRVKARNERARRKTAHKQSQHFKTRNLGNTSSSESPSHEY